MNLFVFTGPTLRPSEGGSLLDATFLPPVQQGDVYALSKQHPWAIGIIDGYFERVPAVWHKEILWAMAHGVRVYGASSMGALRAAELHTLGMRGVGEIFGLFVSGTIEDDDEVTVIHGDADADHVAFSEALVNVRFTLAAAERQGIIGTRTHLGVVAIAKSMFYPDRTFDRVTRQARRDGLDPGELDALVAWLPTGRVDQKRRDAETMLRTMADDFRRESGQPLKVAYQFQHTDAWEQVKRQIDRRTLNTPRAGAHSTTTTGAPFPHDAVLDELRLCADRYAELHREAMIRAMARDLADRDGGKASAAMLRRTIDEFRMRHQLDHAEAVRQWLTDQAYTEPELAELLTRTAEAQRVSDIFEADLDQALADVVRLSGHYPELVERATAKHRNLTERGLDNPTMSEAGIDEPGLMRWYFGERLGRPVPNDLAASAVTLGFTDLPAMRRAVLREYCHLDGCRSATSSG